MFNLFKKIKMEKEVWVMEFLGHDIPLEAVSNFFKVFISVLIAFMAYNIGVNDAQEYLKWTAYFHGIYDPATGVTAKCWPELLGTSKVQWVCENSTRAENIFIGGREYKFNFSNTS